MIMRMICNELYIISIILKQNKNSNLNQSSMKARFNARLLVISSFFLMSTVLVMAQTDKKALELKRLETAVTTAKAKVALNERKGEVADSLVEVGNTMMADAKTEAKAVNAERKKLDKDYAADQKAATKLSNSKDKDEAAKARTDLKAMGVKYRADVKALDTRMIAASKKNSTGESNIAKGKTAKANAKTALKAANESLKTAQERYDEASGTDEKTASKNSKKKK
jgi:hypothetical protein